MTALIFMKALNRFPWALGDRFLFYNRHIADLLLNNGAVMGYQDVCTAC